MVLFTALGVLVPLAVGVALALTVGPWFIWAPLGVVAAITGGVTVFGRRFQHVAFAQVEGKPGAAASVVSGMRGDWKITPAVQLNRAQDVVHRAVGRPGIVLLAEGRGRGVRELLGAEVRRVRRVAGDTPVHDVIVGDGEGEVPLRKLQAHLTKLPRRLRPAEIKELDARLRALAGTAMPIPKGPVPGRPPRGRMR